MAPAVKSIAGDDWTFYRPDAAEWIGAIPLIINSAYDEPVAEQIAIGYAHGGGWMPFEGFVFSPEAMTITYPDDPPYEAVAEVTIRGERVIVYPHAWVMVLQQDGTFQVTKMD